MRAIIRPRAFSADTPMRPAPHEDGIDYYNSGSWIDDRPKYITSAKKVSKFMIIEQPDGHAGENEAKLIPNLLNSNSRWPDGARQGEALRN